MRKYTENPAARAWLTGGLMTAALWAFLCLYADIYFATNDDQFILRTFMGCQPGGAPSFHLYIHGMYAWPLRWLSQLFPGAAWFSILEIGLLSLALVTITKSIIQCFDRAGHRLWVGALSALCFLLLFGMSYCARVTYTSTAALLGAAAVAQMLSIDCKARSDASILRSMTYALLLVVLCYGLRQMTALPVLAYCAIAFGLKYFTCFGTPKRAFRPAKPLLLTLIMVSAVMGGLALGREIEINQRGQREYLDWQQARISVLDYIDLDKLPPEALEAARWSDTLNQLLIKWNTMDEAISTEAFQTIRDTQYTAETRTSAGAAIQDLLSRSPLMVRSALILAGLALICLGLLLSRRKAAFWQMLALMGACGFCLLFFAYLALQGRLPYRAVVVPLLPAAVFVFCLLPDGLPPRREGGNALPLAALCLLTSALSLWYAVPAAQAVKHVPPQWEYNTFEDMDQQALAHPDLLLIYSTELVNDMRMFPDITQGIPTNLMFWGGWQRGSPEYVARLAPFGLQSDAFTAADWLRPELRYITLATEPDATLLAYLRESIDPGVQYEGQKVSDGLYFFRFYLPSAALEAGTAPAVPVH